MAGFNHKKSNSEFIRVTNKENAYLLFTPQVPRHIKKEGLERLTSKNPEYRKMFIISHTNQLAHWQR